MNNFDRHSLALMKDLSAMKADGSNFRTIKNEFGEVRLSRLISRLYPKYSLPELEALTNISDSTLGYWLKYLKIPHSRWHIEGFSIAGNKDKEEIIKFGNSFKKRFTVKITPDLAYLIGFSLGDGSIQKYTVEVFNKDRGLYEHLYRIISNIDKVEEKPLRDYGLWVLRLNSFRISSLIRNGKVINKDTIDYIFDRNALATKFIAAFWDAEGRVAKGRYNYFHIYLYNTDKYLIDRTCSFLKLQGIDYSVHSRFDFKRQYMLKGRSIRSTKPLHRISIPKKSNFVWARKIGKSMQHSKKKIVVGEILSLNR